MIKKKEIKKIRSKKTKNLITNKRIKEREPDIWEEMYSGLKLLGKKYKNFREKQEIKKQKEEQIRLKEQEEGNLDKRFAKLVNRETCSKIAWSIDIHKYLIIGDSHKKISKQDSKILSDSCEALIGAIYIDKGFDFVSKFILDIWKDNLKNSNITILDSKTKLQEYSLKTYKKLPSYILIKAFGPRHRPIFKISVSIPNSKKAKF